MVWQRFAKSPRIACAGSSPAASDNRSDLKLSGMRARLCEGRGRTFKSCQVHQFKQKILRSGRAGKARVSETRLRRFESYLRSQFEKFDAEYTGVVKPPGTGS